MNDLAMRTLKQNSVVIFLDLNLDLIKGETLQNRPLVTTLEDLNRLKETRQPIYRHYADYTISKDTWDEETIVQRIEEALDEYFNTQRP